MTIKVFVGLVLVVVVVIVVAGYGVGLPWVRARLALRWCGWFEWTVRGNGWGQPFENGRKWNDLG